VLSAELNFTLILNSKVTRVDLNLLLTFKKSKYMPTWAMAKTMWTQGCQIYFFQKRPNFQ